MQVAPDIPHIPDVSQEPPSLRSRSPSPALTPKPPLPPPQGRAGAGASIEMDSGAGAGPSAGGGFGGLVVDAEEGRAAGDVESRQAGESPGMRRIRSGLEQFGGGVQKSATGLVKLMRTKLRGPDVERTEEDLRAEQVDKVREIVLYVVFLVVFTTVVFLARDNNASFHFADSLRESIVREDFPPEMSHVPKTYHDIANFADVWDFLEGVFVPTVLQDEWYNGDNFTSQEVGNVLHSNPLIGAIRIRQVRVEPRKCQLPSILRGLSRDCFPEYSDSAQFKGTFVGARGVHYEFASAQELDETTHWGWIDTYPGGGFATIIPRDRTAAEATVQDLKDNRWLDAATRAVFIDFTVYNPASNLFCVNRLVLEFPSTGGVATTEIFRAVNFYRLAREAGIIATCFYGLLYLMVLYYLRQEFLEVRALKWGYFSADPWNILDVINLMIFVIVFGIQVAVDINLARLDVDVSAPDVYVDFQSEAWLATQVANWNAFNGVLCFFKLFKFLGIHGRMSVLTRTLGAALGDISWFLAMFIIVFFGYATAFFIAFGATLGDFRSIVQSVFSLFRSVLGDFDFEAIYQTNRVLGPLLFVSFIILIFFIMLNMFLAIINEAYERVRKQKYEEDPVMQRIRASMRSGYDKFKTTVLRQRQEAVVKAAAEINMSADRDGDGVNIEELGEIVKKNQDAFDMVTSGMTLREILEEFDTNQDEVLDEDEIAQLREVMAHKARELERMQQTALSNARNADSEAEYRQYVLTVMDTLAQKIDRLTAEMQLATKQD